MSDEQILSFTKTVDQVRAEAKAKGRAITLAEAQNEAFARVARAVDAREKTAEKTAKVR
jgi:hypothetical protein